MLKIKSANGVKGCLFVESGIAIFRVYDKHSKPASFVDYELRHSDLFVTIDDLDAYFYKDVHVNLLDHSPNTLGIINDDVSDEEA